MGTGEATSATTNIGDASTDTRGKGPAMAAAPIAAFAKGMKTRGVWGRGVSCFDFLLRLLAICATLAAAIAMGTSDEILPFFTHHYQFRATYYEFPPLTFFVIANALVCGYLVLSLPFSCVGMLRSHAVGLRILLLIFDAVMVAVTTAAASSAATIVYLAHTGNYSANWVAICLRFHGFCQQTSGSLIPSFVAVLILILLVAMAALAIRKH